MAPAASFDITSSVDLQEVDNSIALTADDDFKMSAVWEILQTRMVRRGVPTKNLTLGDPERGTNDTVRRTVKLQQGIPTEAAKEIVKFLKDKKLKKVTAAIMAEQVRVTSPSKDELQEAMRSLREHDFGCALQFGNYRS
jgi:uncharacterized protein YajQ (UPF0234 family)